MDRTDLLPILFNLFREYGYEGVSLSKISQATGLGKASLYHHFPNGKAEMLQAALAYSQQWFEENVLHVLYPNRSPLESGTISHQTSVQTPQGCQEQVKLRMQRLIVAIATVLTEQGLSANLAQQRAEEALIMIQGSLILARGLNKPALFQRILSNLPDTLCKP